MDVMAPMYFSPDVITTNPAVIDTPVMTFMPPPTPAPQPNPQPLNIGSATAFSWSGTQYAGVTANPGLTTSQAYMGQYASPSHYAASTTVLGQAAGVAGALSRGDFGGAMRQGAMLGGSAYLNSGSLGRVGMDFMSGPGYGSGSYSLDGAPMSFGSPGQ